MSQHSHTYNPSEIEPKWQNFWAEQKTFYAESSGDGPTCYLLDMFPYPSGAGLHIGHPEGYTATDALKRFERARGKQVLHAMGWDAFGLPTEQFAIKTGRPPREVTEENIQNFKRQLKAIGLTYDESREVNTTDPAYFRWTQWIFLKLFEQGLAYVDEKPVWFCPELGTVLANEEVLNTAQGPRSERGNFPVEKKPLRQWVLRITAYAERLLEGLEGLDWPSSTKALQANWIGKSTGAEVAFATEVEGASLTVFTTRPDTLYGATYMVIAPEHPLVGALTTQPQQAAVSAYVEAAKRKSDLERAELAKEKSGVFTGSYAINPVNGQRIPVWVADYVLITYGTGAIMAVPAHDERDFAFAKAFDLEVTRVIAGEDADADQPLTEAYTGDGLLVNSGPLNGLRVAEAKQKIIERLEAEGCGKATVNYKLRDWLFSRQRYWGEPFPILWVSEADHARLAEPLRGPQKPVTCQMQGQTWVAVALPQQQLPLQLPEVEDFKPSPDGQSPLAKAKQWLHVCLDPLTGKVTPRGAGGAVPEGQLAALRETNTMPQWAGSCWYYLRYMDPDNTECLVGPEAEARWGCPDLYVGGQEHAVLHLLYARFWHLFLKDIGVVTTPEPFKRLFHQGIILGEDGEKMSKSRGNVVNPDQIIAEHGADALRCYLMFLGPLEQMKPWNTENIRGITRFLRDVWRLVINEADGTLSPKVDPKRAVATAPELQKALHQTIKKVTEDYESLSFNTALSALMIFKNTLQKAEHTPLEALQVLVQLLAPLAPHLAEELWQRLGGTTSVAEVPWPRFDPVCLVEASATVAVQVMGKVRGTLELPVDAQEAEAVARARQLERVAAALEGKRIIKTIYVPGRILNFVAK